MRLNRMLAPAAVFAVAVVALPGRPAGAVQKGWYEKAVKSIAAKFDPAEAKPGQTVTFTLTVALNDGYHTYPTVQPDKMAAGMENTITFPAPGPVVFVGRTLDPKGYQATAEPVLGIKELRTYSGTTVFTRTAVVSPAAKPGPAAVKLAAFKLLVCDDNNCFPPKTVPVEAALKVLDGPAVPVEKEYAAEVTKALAGK